MMHIGLYARNRAIKSLVLLHFLVCTCNSNALNVVVIKLSASDCAKCYISLEDIFGKLDHFKIEVITTSGNSGRSAELLSKYKNMVDSFIISDQQFYELSDRADSEVLLMDNNKTRVFLRAPLVEFSAHLDNWRTIANYRANRTVLNSSLDLAGCSVFLGDNKIVTIHSGDGKKVWKLQYDSDLNGGLYSTDSFSGLMANYSELIDLFETNFGHKFQYQKSSKDFEKINSAKQNSLIPNLIDFEGTYYSSQRLYCVFNVNRLEKRYNKKMGKWDYRISPDHAVVAFLNDSIKSSISALYFLDYKPKRNMSIRTDEIFFVDDKLICGLEKLNVKIPWGNQIVSSFDTSVKVLELKLNSKIRTSRELRKMNRRAGFDFKLIGNGGQNYFWMMYEPQIYYFNNRLPNSLHIEINPNKEELVKNIVNYKDHLIDYLFNCYELNTNFLLVQKKGLDLHLIIYNKFLNKITDEFALGSFGGCTWSNPKFEAGNVKWIISDYSSNTLSELMLSEFIE